MGEPDLNGGGGDDLVAALNGAVGHGLGSPAIALGLKAVFSGILQERKAKALAAADGLLKEEEKALRNSHAGQEEPDMSSGISQPQISQVLAIGLFLVAGLGARSTTLEQTEQESDLFVDQFLRRDGQGDLGAQQIPALPTHAG